MELKEFKQEKTLVIIKPDGIQRGLIGEIIKRFENVGLKLIAVKMTTLVPDFIEKHYTINPEWRKVTGEKTIKNYKDKGLIPPHDDPYKITEIILGNMKKYMSAGPVIAMILEGAHAIKIVRKLVGGTEPLTSDVGTIRGDYVLDSYQMSDTDGRSIRNLIHASGSVEDAEKEISLWFSPEEIVNYRLVQEKILYDVNLDGILE
ncbi:MAG: nucleoside-diphosphate kinase [bacterium]|nr:nucleoside-diphosphate kinase [bacterium]